MNKQIGKNLTNSTIGKVKSLSMLCALTSALVVGDLCAHVGDLNPAPGVSRITVRNMKNIDLINTKPKISVPIEELKTAAPVELASVLVSNLDGLKQLSSQINDPKNKLRDFKSLFSSESYNNLANRYHQLIDNKELNANDDKQNAEFAALLSDLLPKIEVISGHLMLISFCEHYKLEMVSHNVCFGILLTVNECLENYRKPKCLRQLRSVALSAFIGLVGFYLATRSFI